MAHPEDDAARRGRKLNPLLQADVLPKQCAVGIDGTSLCDCQLHRAQVADREPEHHVVVSDRGGSQDRNLTGSGAGDSQRGRNRDSGEQPPRHVAILARFGRLETQGRGGFASPSALLFESVYDVGTGATSGARTVADLLRRKSATDATATQSSQNSIVKKMSEKIAATPATKPNQLIQRGRIA